MSNNWSHALSLGFVAAIMVIGGAVAGPISIENDSESAVVELYVFPPQDVDVLESEDKSFAGANLVASGPMAVGDVIETDVNAGEGHCEFTVVARHDDGYQQENYIDFCSYSIYRIDSGVDYDSVTVAEPAGAEPDEVVPAAPCDIEADVAEIEPALRERFPDLSAAEAAPYVEKFEKLIMAAMADDGAAACATIAEMRVDLGMSAPVAILEAHVPSSMVSPEFLGMPEENRGIWASPDCVAAESLSIYSATDTFYSSEGWVGLSPIASIEKIGRFDRVTLGGPVDPAIAYFIGRADNGTLSEIYIPDHAPADALPWPEWDRESFQRCDIVPARFSLYGEVVTWIEALPALRAGCAAGAEGDCLEAVWRLADVSGDGLLSLAELSRILRILTQAAVVSHEDGAKTEELVAATLGAVLTAPLAGNLILASLDYDDDGRLSPEEALQDRANLVDLLQRPELRDGLDITAITDELSNLEGLARMLMQ